MPAGRPLLSHNEPSDESGRGTSSSTSLQLVSQALDTNGPAFRPLSQHPVFPAPHSVPSKSTDGGWSAPSSQAPHRTSLPSQPERNSPPSKRAREDINLDTVVPESPSPLQRVSMQAEDVDDSVIAASSDRSAGHLVSDSPVPAALSADHEASHSPAPLAPPQLPENADGAEDAMVWSDASDSSAPSFPPPAPAAPAPQTKRPLPLPLELPFPLGGRSKLVHTVPREHTAFQAAMEFLVYRYYAANS